ncbi:S1, putative [Brugia malayi]|uniref:Bm1383 n=1 Tax=Brugia malayi TaxID=6279 RepID=A0A0K0IZ65_BRUMA|nr:S1, putative [Brugia malayi]CDQ03848.1 Bm1383 [Brugia malayi]VIO95256.1 S1, putative [Brugia malayi]
MFSTFTVVLACIVLIVGKGEAFSDYECVDEEEEGDVNCKLNWKRDVHLKLLSKQVPYFVRTHATFVTLT